jgi:hypothetical protein
MLSKVLAVVVVLLIILLSVTACGYSRARDEAADLLGKKAALELRVKGFVDAKLEKAPTMTDGTEAPDGSTVVVAVTGTILPTLPPPTLTACPEPVFRPVEPAPEVDPHPELAWTWLEEAEAEAMNEAIDAPWLCPPSLTWELKPGHLYGSCTFDLVRAGESALGRMTWTGSADTPHGTVTRSAPVEDVELDLVVAAPEIESPPKWSAEARLGLGTDGVTAGLSKYGKRRWGWWASATWQPSPDDISGCFGKTNTCDPFHFSESSYEVRGGIAFGLGRAAKR